MRHLIAILSNHDHWWAFPVVGHVRGDTYLFLDHRSPIAERAAAIRDVAAAEDVGEVMRVVLEPAEVDCAGGIHDWQIIVQNEIAIGAECRPCGEVEAFDFAMPTLRNCQSLGQRV